MLYQKAGINFWSLKRGGDRKRPRIKNPISYEDIIAGKAILIPHYNRIISNTVTYFTFPNLRNMFPLKSCL